MWKNNLLPHPCGCVVLTVLQIREFMIMENDTNIVVNKTRSSIFGYSDKSN